jgi:hypothetical protein
MRGVLSIIISAAIKDIKILTTGLTSPAFENHFKMPGFFLEFL